MRVKELEVDRAGHSPGMDKILDDFENTMRSVDIQPPQITVISSLTGKRATNDICTAAYWRKHLREPVQFAAGVDLLDGLKPTAFLEIGPAPVSLRNGEHHFATTPWTVATEPPTREGRLGTASVKP